MPSSKILDHIEDTSEGLFFFTDLFPKIGNFDFQGYGRSEASLQSSAVDLFNLITLAAREISAFSSQSNC